MTNHKVGLLRRLTNGVGFYVGIPMTLFVFVVFALFWRPTAEWIFGLSVHLDALKLPAWTSDVPANVVANMLAAAIVGVPIWMYFTSRKLKAFAKTYEAFNVMPDGSKELFGQLKLRYELLPSTTLQPRYKCELESTIPGLVLCGYAVLVQDQYLVGYYREKENHIRRRAGAFVMQLDGNGNVFEGNFSFIDPNTQAPASGKARWEMI